MTSPAERYAASRMRHAESRSVLGQFRKSKDFELDPFQIDACKALESGHGVLVAAPTGAGKTVVGEFAIHLARHQGGKAFYTTPIKALSNQKFQELQSVYGTDQVGLLTGDVSINSSAPIVVMTTEVLRNMLYVGSEALSGLTQVVMDEVHYLADRSRGAVWEEVILHLPQSVSITALSATVSNAEEFGDWLAQVRGETTVVVEEHRPVPLWQLVAADRDLLDLFVDEEQNRVNPELVRLARDEQHAARRQGGRPRRSQISRHTPFHDRLIRMLEQQSLLPAIWFIFSRSGCDLAVQRLLSQNLKLTTPTERRRITEIVDVAVTDIPDEDLVALDFATWRHALECGIAAHHAGLIPRFKEIVETLFQQGLLKVVFATETLALGINMPAKTVVLERLSKWNGDNHAPLTPGEYTQLTGRAGRRGIDDEGNAVVVWQADIEPSSLAGLASTRTYPLKSSFKPGYTMAVNTVAAMGYERAVDLLGQSFAQFQADKGVAGLLNQLQKQDAALAGYLEAMECHLGDFREYAELRAQLATEERAASRGVRAADREAQEQGLARLDKGDVVYLQSGRRKGPAVVVDVKPDFGNGPRVSVLTLGREVRRVNPHDLPNGAAVIGKLRIGREFDTRSAKDRARLAQELGRHDFSDGTVPNRKTRRSNTTEDRIAEIRANLKAHPCHGCGDREQHARWGERYLKLRGERSALANQVQHRTNVLARDFTKVCSILTQLGYLTSADETATVTAKGQLLRRIHAEGDLLVSEAVARGVFEELPPLLLVPVLSTIVYEPRREEPESNRVPKGSSPAIEALVALWSEVSALELEAKLPTSPKPQTGFALQIHRWATGAPLVQVLRESDLSAGDFVRTTRRLIDLMEQLAAATDGQLALNLRAALDLVRRGIVSEADWSED